MNIFAETRVARNLERSLLTDRDHTLDFDQFLQYSTTFGCLRAQRSLSVDRSGNDARNTAYLLYRTASTTLVLNKVQLLSLQMQ